MQERLLLSAECPYSRKTESSFDAGAAPDTHKELSGAFRLFSVINNMEQIHMTHASVKDAAVVQPLTDVQTLRKRARQHIEGGAVTSGYAG